MKREPADPIAEVHFELVKDGVRVPIRAWIGRPYVTEFGNGACPAGIDGLHGRYSDCQGEDPMQALGLAMRRLRVELRIEMERGLVLFHAGTPERVTTEEVVMMLGLPEGDYLF